MSNLSGCCLLIDLCIFNPMEYLSQYCGYTINTLSKYLTCYDFSFHQQSIVDVPQKYLKEKQD